MVTSEPMLETDFYRYLWDGGVVAAGENPYRPIPARISGGSGRLSDLGRDSGIVLQRVNHPELRTIYPPVAQGFFALSHFIAPWNLTAWRGVLLVADVATFVLLLLVLARADLPRAYSLIYWLNPIVLKEIHNAAHMDILLAPFVLGALLLAHRGRLYTALTCVAFATGIKLWPILLLPLILRAGTTSWIRATGPVLLYATIVGLMLVPVFLAGLDSTSGFTAYAGRWEMNNGPSLILIAMGRWFETFGLLPFSARAFSSGLSILIIGAGVLVAIRRPVTGIEDLAVRFLLVVALLFLLSPTQFPWYAVWFLPLLAIRPNPALLLYALTLPLYYLRFRYVEAGLMGWFDNVIVWLEHGPVLVLLAAAKWKPGWLSFQPREMIQGNFDPKGAQLLSAEANP
jgi:hypothetical protein